MGSGHSVDGNAFGQSVCASRHRGSAPPKELSFPPDADSSGLSMTLLVVTYALRSARQRSLSRWWSGRMCILSCLKAEATPSRPMVVTGSTERPAWTPVLRPLSSYCITAAGLLGLTPLVNRTNAAKGSWQTGRVPLEDSVAPEAKPSGLIVAMYAHCLWAFSGVVDPRAFSRWGCFSGRSCCMRPMGGVSLPSRMVGGHQPGVCLVAHVELMLRRGI